MPCRSSFARELGLSDGVRGKRRGEQHVVQRNSATPSLAGLLRRGKQFLRVQIRDNQLPLGVGHQNRVGDGVDDAVEEHPLLPESCFCQGRPADETSYLATEQPRRPGDVRVDFRTVATDEEETLSAVIVFRAQRNRVEGCRHRRLEAVREFEKSCVPGP